MKKQKRNIHKIQKKPQRTRKAVKTAVKPKFVPRHAKRFWAAKKIAVQKKTAKRVTVAPPDRHSPHNVLHEKKIRKQKDKMERYVVNQERIDSLLSDPHFSDYVNTNVHNKAVEIIKMLAVPQPDDFIAEKTGMKINDIRKIINRLNTDGIAKYIVYKNDKGWLLFKWYIDHEKIEKLTGELALRKEDFTKQILPSNCNDFFVCEKCKNSSDEVLPFVDAFKADFKCGRCNKTMKMITRSHAEQIIEARVSIIAAKTPIITEKTE